MDTYGNTKTKNISDYLHLYLGCDVKLNGNKVNRSLTSYMLNEIENGHWQDDIKPILRPLSDMSEEEKIMLCCLNMPNGWQPGHIYETNDDDIAAMRIFDYQGDYKSLYIPKKRISPNNFLWLLSKHFDLFGLIEAGLALDATKI